jgi:hypothetical protein
MLGGLLNLIEWILIFAFKGLMTLEFDQILISRLYTTRQEFNKDAEIEKKSEKDKIDASTQGWLTGPRWLVHSNCKSRCMNKWFWRKICCRKKVSDK